MGAMQGWGGIGMIQDLHYRYMMIMGNWIDIIYLQDDY